MKRFVVVGEGRRKGHVGTQLHESYDAVREDIEFSDHEVLSCLLSDLRELDATPIAAGDEVVCVDASDSKSDQLTVGKSYIAHSVAAGGVWVENNGGHRCVYVPGSFVKVKPQPAPEVKQEAAEPEMRKFAAVPDGSNPSWFFTEEEAIDFARENVSSSGDVSECHVFRLIASVESLAPKVTRFV